MRSAAGLDADRRAPGAETGLHVEGPLARRAAQIDGALVERPVGVVV